MAHEQTIVILGASGDLTSRLLLPGLASLVDSGHTGDLLLIGSSVDDWSQEDWRERVRGSIGTLGEPGEKSTALAESAALNSYLTNITDVAGISCSGVP